MSNPNRAFCPDSGRPSTNRRRPVIGFALALGLGLASALATALPEDQQQPIRITADAAVQENNTVTYRGNVVVVQGTIRIAADQVLIYHDKGKLQRAVATGKPVHFQEQPDTKGGLMTGHAATVIYYNTDQRVELIQDALVERDQSVLKGQRIEDLMPTEVLRADGAAQNTQPGRVEMVLQPNKDKAAAETPPAGATVPAPSPSPAPAPAAQPPAESR
jgi:lipopolysaccharide export system protein LptA